MSSQNSVEDVSYVRLFEHFYEGKRISHERTPIAKAEKPPRIFFDGKEIAELHISQSLIKKLLFKGEELPNLCPFRILHMELLRDTKFEPSLAMLYGLYFEQGYLGKSAYDEKIEIPKSKRSGEKLTAEKRIDEAILRAKRITPKHGMIILDNNVQIKASKEWRPKDPKKFTWFKIFINGVSDIITPFTFEDTSYPICCVDVKLGGDRDLCYVDKYEPWKTFPWGCPAEMDHTQATMYDELFEMPFVYLVFDYRKNDPGYKVIPVLTMHGYPNDKTAIERHRALHRDIEWVVTKIVMWNEDNWPKERSNTCLKCPVKSCEFRNKHTQII